MLRVLITGASGFVGHHLVAYLQAHQSDARLHGTFYRLNEQRTFPAGVNFTEIDLLNPMDVRQLLDKVRPDAIYHLAAQSSPSRAAHAAWQTLETNIRSQFNLLNACIELGLNPRILVISSAEIYDNRQMPQVETTPLAPTNPYALSKATQDLMALQYALSNQLALIRVRPFNHTGPGQRETFVAPDFAVQIARIEVGLQEPVMLVGNLSPERDFTDVRDVVRAYHLLMEQAPAGEVYNVAANRAYSVQWILDTLLSYSQATIDIRIDQNKLRSVDLPIKIGSYEKLRQLTGWQPSIPFEKTLLDLLNDCRQRVQYSMRK